jgi:hypothetical protein
MAAATQVAQEAWRVVITQMRTEIYVYLDSIHRLSMGFWRSYGPNNLGEDAGPLELFHKAWYRRNRFWGPWLLRAHTWAKQKKVRKDALVDLLQRQCGLYHMMFHANENYMDETLYIALAETTEMLDCYIRGWRYAMRELDFDDWIFFGNQGAPGNNPAPLLMLART